MINIKFEKASEFSEEVTLPDILNYWDSNIIKIIYGCEIIFSIDETEINPTEGSKKLSIFIYPITKVKDMRLYQIVRWLSEFLLG